MLAYIHAVHIILIEAMSYIGSCYDLQELESIRLPIKYRDLEDDIDKYQMQMWPTMDHHSIACYLIEKAGLQIAPDMVREYWNRHAQMGEPWAIGMDTDRIPIGIYGDGARVNTTFGSENVIGLFMNFVLWKPQSVRTSRFLIFAIPEHLLWKRFTMNAVLRRVTWSINHLIEGKHPVKGPYNEDLPHRVQLLAGRPLSFRCALMEIRGDWSWHKKIWAFHRVSWNGIDICHNCPAKSKSDCGGDLYWTFEGNTWDDRHFTKEEFIAHRMPPRGICFLDF